jgi:hypothetical protein
MTCAMWVNIKVKFVWEHGFLVVKFIHCGRNEVVPVRQKMICVTGLQKIPKQKFDEENC